MSEARPPRGPNAGQPAARKARRAAARTAECACARPAPIVPPANIQGNALMVVIAIMAFLACLTLGAVSMVRSTAPSWESQISREITIQIKPDDKLDMEKALADARDLALTFVGTTDGTDRRQGGDRPPARTLARRRPRPRRPAGAAPRHHHHRRDRTRPTSTRCATLLTETSSAGLSRRSPHLGRPAGRHGAHHRADRHRRAACWSSPPWC